MLDSTEKKLLEVLKKRFDCKLKVHYLNLSENIEGENNWTELEKTIYRNRLAKFFISGSNIIFPIYRSLDLVVAIDLQETSHLKPQEILMIKDCVELVFDDIYLLKKKRDLSVQRQAYLESQLLPPNVIAFPTKHLH